MYNIATALCVLQLLGRCARPVPKMLQVSVCMYNIATALCVLQLLGRCARPVPKMLQVSTRLPGRY